MFKQREFEVGGLSDGVKREQALSGIARVEHRNGGVTWMSVLDPEMFSGGENFSHEFVSERGDGVLEIQEDAIEHGPEPNGSYTHIVDHGKKLERLQKATCAEDFPNGVKVLSETDESVRRAFRGISLLVNLKDEEGEPVEMDDLSLGVLYTANFVSGMMPVVEQAIRTVGEGSTFIAPWRGGETLQEIIMAKDWDEDLIVSMPKVRFSRIMLKDGSYLVGAFPCEEDAVITDKVIFGDDCRAASGSEDLAFRWALDKNPKIRNIASVVGQSAKSSAEVVYNTWEPRLPYESFAGDMTNSMNKEYYLQMTGEERSRKNLPDDCLWTVNDMGDAMSLVGSRGRLLKPVIKGVVNGSVDPELLFEATETVYERPGDLESWARIILDKVL